MGPKALLSSNRNVDGANSPELGVQAMFSDLRADLEGRERKEEVPRRTLNIAG